MAWFVSRAILFRNMWFDPLELVNDYPPYLASILIRQYAETVDKRMTLFDGFHGHADS